MDQKLRHVDHHLQFAFFSPRSAARLRFDCMHPLVWLSPQYESGMELLLQPEKAEDRLPVAPRLLEALQAAQVDLFDVLHHQQPSRGQVMF